MAWQNNSGELIHTHPNMYLQGTFADNGSYSFVFFKNNSYRFGYTITIKLNNNVIGTFGTDQLNYKSYTSPLMTGTMSDDTVRCALYCTMESCNIGGHAPNGHEIFTWTKPVPPPPPPVPVDTYQYMAVYHKPSDGDAKWYKAKPYVYHNGEWHEAEPYIYHDGRWHSLNSI